MQATANLQEREFGRLPPLASAVVRLVAECNPLFPGSTNCQEPRGLRSTQLETTGRAMPLWDAKPLRSDAITAEIFVRTDRGSYFKAAVPDEIQSRLAKLLNEGTPHAQFECLSLISFLSDVPFDFKVFDLTKWEVLPISNLKDLRPGDSILLVNGKPGESEITYGAFYLGRDMFLSKWGAQGGLAISNFEGLNQAFSGERIIRIAPKRDLEGERL